MSRQSLDMQDGAKLFVGGIPPASATEAGVTELFSELGGCFPLEVVLLPAKGQITETRCAFVRIPSDMLSQTVEAMNGLRFEDVSMPLAVRLADNQAKPGAGGQAFSPPPSHAPRVIAARTFHSDTGGLDSSSAPHPAGDPHSTAAKVAQAKAAGRWLEVAEWMELEYSTAGETFEAKVERLRRALIAAAVEEHFYEAASLEEALNQLDPQAAAAANAAAAKALAQRGTTAPVVNAHAAAATAMARAKMAAQTVPPPQWASVAPTTAPPAAAGGMTDYAGTILSYRAEKHFGFIQCAELGVDAFVSSYQINGFNVGDQVMFNVSFNNHGKPQAQNLRALEGSFQESAAKRMRM